MTINVATGFPFTSGSLEVHIATQQSRPDLVRQAKELRLRAFYTDPGIPPPPEAVAAGYDEDSFDKDCDHLVVYDPQNHIVAGTYRMRRQTIAQAHGGFYSATEFDLSPLLQSVPRGLLEVGRVCTHPAYGDTVLMRLFMGIAVYVAAYHIEYLFGCGSFPGADPDQHAEGLQFLHDHYLLPRELRVRARRGKHYVRMSRGLPRRKLHDPPFLPPLIDFYRRVGPMFVGQGGVLDRRMDTTDVFLLVPIATVSARYRDRLLRGR